MLLESTWSMLLKLLIAAGLGAILGVERQLRHRPAGIRTSLFICLGSCMFTLLSGALAQAWGDNSPTRIAANLVQGIGFLGAGAILRDRGNVVGLTTASVIFVLAAVGMGVAGGFYLLCTLTVLFMLLMLFTLGWVEEATGLKTRPMLFRFTTTNLEGAVTRLHECLAQLKLQMQRFQVLRMGPGFTLEFEAETSSAQAHTIVSTLSVGSEHCEVVERDDSSSQ